MKFLALTLKNVKSTPLTGNSDQEIQSTVWNTKSFVDRVEIPDVVDAAGNLLSPSMVTGLICRVPKKARVGALDTHGTRTLGQKPWLTDRGVGANNVTQGWKNLAHPFASCRKQAFISSPQRHICKYSRHWQAGYKPLSWTNYWHGLIFQASDFFPLSWWLTRGWDSSPSFLSIWLKERILKTILSTWPMYWKRKQMPWNCNLYSGAPNAHKRKAANKLPISLETTANIFTNSVLLTNN